MYSYFHFQAAAETQRLGFRLKLDQVTVCKRLKSKIWQFTIFKRLILL